MTLKTSLLITGDASTAIKAVEELNRGLQGLGTASQSAAGGVAQVDKTEDGAATAARAMAGAVTQSVAAIQQMAAAATAASAALASVSAGATASTASVSTVGSTISDTAGDAKLLDTSANAASRSIAALGAASAGAVAGVSNVARADEAAAQSAKALSTELAAALLAVRELSAGATAAAGGLTAVEAITGKLSEAVEGATGKIKDHAGAANDNSHALDGMAGKAGVLGSVLSATGIWGIAVSAGIGLLTGFAQGLFEGGDKTDKLKDKALSLEGALQKQAIGTDAARKAIEDYNRAQANAIEQDSLATDRAIRLAEARFKEAGATIASTKARLGAITAADQEAVRNPQFGARGDAAGLSGGRSAAQSAVAGALREQEEAAKRVETALAGLYTTRAKDNSKAATDQTYALNRAYDRQRDAAIRAAQGSAARSKALDGELTAIERRRKAALDAQKEDGKKGGGTGTAGADAAAAAKLASATNDVERAQAQLTITRREANAALKAHTITQAEATARITAAENALNAAQAAAKAHAGAVRDVAKASREAEAESRRLDTAADAIRVRFGEMDSAAGRYKKTLEDIVKLTAAGKLSSSEGLVYGMRASLEETKRTNPEAFKTSFDQASIGKDIKAIEEHAAAETEAAAAARHAAGGFKTAADTVAGAVSQAFGSKAGSIVSGLGSIADRLSGSPESVAASKKLEDAIHGIAKGVGITDTAASTIGKFAGKGIEGAATGALVNSVFAPIAKGLGLKTSQTGAQIGGAIGSAIPIPGGQIIGSILGSIVGGLFKTTKNGGATIAADGSISTSGNSASRQASAASAAGSVIDGVKQIASQLGGTVGKLSSITIGTYGKNDEYRVNTAGGTQLGGSSSKLANVEYFGSGEAGAAAALAYAIQLQVQRGAVEGLSAAVQKAIKSSSDLNAALQEAVKVQDVELIAKGLTGQFEKAFKELEATAKERVRIATEYGLDVVAIEKKNAQDRAALVDQLTKQQAGSLQSLVTDLTSGDLFEGSYKDKIAAIGGRIDKAKADLEAGVAGSADTLADLYRQKLAAEKDAYGETATYAASRNSTIADAQAAIARVNAQITAAKSDPALVETNAALDENNGQNAEMLAVLARIDAKLGGSSGSATSGSYFDLASLAAT